MSTNVGAIDMELLLNSNPFNRGLKNTEKTIKSSGIEKALGNIGKITLAAFSVNAIVNFGKECLNLGSDLAEVQNVVDVTFGELNSEVNKFAENAIEKFGLGQTVAKQYTGTFGAMAKAFDFNNQAALEMSETLTGLVGDVASFYNLSSDLAYTKLKSVFTGETETLKDLGVVMTQNALDQYALANGYGKTTSKMSEQEKVALRYKFVLDKLSVAQGDFARTSDSWANQTRVLSLRFNELKATLGQGFINIFTPIVKGINSVIARLQVLANVFKSFTEMIFGNTGGDNGSNSISNLTADATNASDAIGGIGDSAKKSAKDLKSLASFDTAQVLKSDKDSSSGGSGGAGALGNIDFGNTVLDMQQANTQMDLFAEKLRELTSIFKEGFSEGFGEIDFSNITNSIENIKNSLSEIFTSAEVLNSANNWANTIALNLGRVTGSIASIGITIAENLIGGIDLYLEQNQENIRQHIVNLFDISSESSNIAGKFSVALSDIFTVFRSDVAKQATADFISIIVDSLLGSVEVIATLANDIFYSITQPFIDNKDLIKFTLEELFVPIESILNTLKETVQNTFSKFWEVYEQYISPAVEKIKNGFSIILEGAINAFSNYLLPVFNTIAERIGYLKDNFIQPLIDSFLELSGSVINSFGNLLEFVSPIISFLINEFFAKLSLQIQKAWTYIEYAVSAISSILTGFMEVLTGIINFVTGVFTGDWQLAWDGIKQIFQGIWDGIYGVLTAIWNAIVNTITYYIDLVSTRISRVLNTIQILVSSVFTAISNVIKTVISGITNVINLGLNGISRTFNNIFNGILNIVKSVCNSILRGIEAMVNGVIKGLNTMINAMNSLHFDIPDWVPGLGGKNFGFNIPNMNTISLPRLAQGAYVKANTPQLVMVGDNKHQGEVIAPEDKIMSLYKKANQEIGLGNDSKVIELLQRIIYLLETLDFNFNLYIDAYELNKRLEKIKNKRKFATNGG